MPFGKTAKPGWRTVLAQSMIGALALPCAHTGSMLKRGLQTAGDLGLATWRAIHGERSAVRGVARRRLIVLTRFPAPGSTKTRLIPVLGQVEAAELQRLLTENTVRAARRTARRMSIEVEIRFTGAQGWRVSQWLGRGLSYRCQANSDLGQRMREALEDALRQGCRSAVLVGSDIPAISAQLLCRAFKALERTDAVFGPADDGGYYLVGLRRPAPQLFRAMPWGEGSVLERTLSRARLHGISTTCIDRLRDVDRPEDLAVAVPPAVSRALRAVPERISVVIPALNEATNLGETVAAVRTGRNVEILVADGGSEDATVDVAQRLRCRVVRQSGRARQMNAAAEAAEGELLLFLHADTALPPGWDTEVRRALSLSRVSIGAFRFGIRGAAMGLRAVEAWVNARSVVHRLPYGDQALFMRAEEFRQMGGFSDMPIMEDYDLVHRARRAGRVVIVPRRVMTSARRWRGLGVWRTSLLNHLVVGGYRLGISPERLARWYSGR